MEVNVKHARRAFTPRGTIVIRKRQQEPDVSKTISAYPVSAEGGLTRISIAAATQSLPPVLSATREAPVMRERCLAVRAQPTQNASMASARVAIVARSCGGIIEGEGGPTMGIVRHALRGTRLVRTTNGANA